MLSKKINTERPPQSVKFEIVDADQDGLRLDRYVSLQSGLPYGYVAKLIRTGQIRVEGQRAAANQRVLTGQTVRIPPFLEVPEKKILPLSPSEEKKLKEWILFENEHVLVLNKPQGLAVQGGTKVGLSLDHLLLRYGGMRLVHRLDKETSGLLIVAKERKTAQLLTQAFRERKVGKIYWALVWGHPPLDKGVIHLHLKKKEENVEVDPEGAEAITHYRVLTPFDQMTLVELIPLTGRTHQLRVHMKAIGTPIVGDQRYGICQGKPPVFKKHLYLHAKNLSLQLPGQDKIVTFEAPLPPHFNHVLG